MERLLQRFNPDFDFTGAPVECAVFFPRQAQQVYGRICLRRRKAFGRHVSTCYQVGGPGKSHNMKIFISLHKA